jgi:hypothetical protein
MAQPLVLTPDQARTVIRASEGRLDQYGSEGHTIRRHISITREQLALRTEAGPAPQDPKPVFWRSAFLSLDSAASVLSEAIGNLAGNDVVARFSVVPDGTELRGDPIVSRFDCRDMRGRFPAAQVHIFARKMAERPYALHLISLYPVIML